MGVGGRDSVAFTTSEAIATHMADEQNDQGAWVIATIVGLAFGWFTLTGGIGGFILLRWVGLAPLVADATAPLGAAGQAVLGVAATVVNFILLVFSLEVYYQYRDVL